MITKPELQNILIGPQHRDEEESSNTKALQRIIFLKGIGNHMNQERIKYVHCSKAGNF